MRVNEIIRVNEIHFPTSYVHYFSDENVIQSSNLILTLNYQRKIHANILTVEFM